MPKGIRKNITNQKFSKLYVVEQFKKNNKCYCKCKCDCGNLAIVEYWNLVTGHTSTCGCLLKNKQYDNMIGTRFGKLVVKKLLYRDKNAHNHYLCRCDCGNEVDVLGVNLIYNQTKSCGCLKKKSSYMKKIPITNKSGVKGVCFDKYSKKWIASVSVNGKKIRNSFFTFEEAVERRKELEEQFYKPIIEQYK